MKAKFDLIAQVLGFRNFKHMENVSSAGCAARRKKKGLTSRYGVAAIALLALAVTVGAQGVETLGAGTPTTTCSYSGACTAPVVEGDGTPNGTIEIHASTGILHRYGIDGAKLWDATDFHDGVFTHDGVQGSLSYTVSQVSRRCGGSGRYVYTCTYRWVSGGSLAE